MLNSFRRKLNTSRSHYPGLGYTYFFIYLSVHPFSSLLPRAFVKIICARLAKGSACCWHFCTSVQGSQSNWSRSVTNYLFQLLSTHLHTDLSRQDSKLRCVTVKGGEISWKRDRCRGLDYVDYCIVNFLGLNFKVENG